MIFEGKAPRGTALEKFITPSRTSKVVSIEILKNIVDDNRTSSFDRGTGDASDFLVATASQLRTFITDGPLIGSRLGIGQPAELSSGAGRV